MIDGRVSACFRCCFGVLFEALVKLRTYFCEIGGSAVRGNSAGILRD